MKLFENVRLHGLLVSAEDFRIGCDMPETVLGETEQAVIREAAEKALAQSIPLLPATLYMRFYRDGDRSEYEELYFRRRSLLRALTMGEMLEKKGRYLDKIIDLLWAICEETSWVIPAHNHQESVNGGSYIPLPRHVTGSVRIIDLFSAETGAELAHTLYHLRDALAAVSPSIPLRVEYCIEKHLLTPFEKYLYWWEGYYGGVPNNWNPWILSNLLLVIGVTEKSWQRRESLCEKALAMLDRFVDTYSPDGGCDEGPSYWAAAGASLYDCLETLYDLTGGRVNCIRTPLVEAMCDYFRKAYISGRYVMNFADAPASMRIYFEARLLTRMGRRLKCDALSAFACYAGETGAKDFVPYELRFRVYRFLRDLYERVGSYTGGGIAQAADFPGIVVAVRREKADFDKGFYFAMKGGTNGESHNHNDIGNFVLYRDGKPVIIDIGVGTYSKKTFSEERYTIPAMTSAYHNLPLVGGHQQPPGLEYVSRNASFTPEGLAVDIQAAYPPEAGILRWRRSSRLAEGTVTVTDSFRLTDSKKIDFVFITPLQPQCNGDGKLLLGSTTCTYPSALSCTVEEYPFDDPAFTRAWQQDKVYRILLSGEMAEGELTFLFQ